MSLREALEKRADELEAADAGEAPEAPTPEPVEAAEPEAAPAVEAPPRESKAERARDPAGKFMKELKADFEERSAKAAKVAPRAAAPAAKMPPVPGGQPGTTPAPAPAPAKAPQSWKPALREKFAQLPPDIQEEAVRVERTYQRIIQENAQLKQAAQAANPYQETLRPYEATIRASGMEPHQYIGSMMQQVHALTYGPDHVKADSLANIIMQFAPHLLKPDQQDAQGNPSSPLDRALVARLQGRQVPQAPSQQFQDPRVDKMLAALQEQAQRRAASAQEEASSKLEAIANDPAYEFLPDVLDHMEQIFRFWDSQGKKQLSDADIKKAYDWACRENPDVAQVYEQRREAEQARKALASTQQARLAASSPRSQPTEMPVAKPKGLRAALEARADELGIP